MARLDASDFARASALIVRAGLINVIEKQYPDLTMKAQDDILVDILDRVARLNGWSLRRDVVLTEEEDG